jgi:REP element-mobilizing transposase RayT
MANTYTQCYFHLVFSPKNKEALIKKEWKDELEKYITSVIQNNKHKLLAIGGIADHIHILIGYNVNERIPDLIEEIKTSSTKWIKEKKMSAFKFEWQRGYGAFTHSKSQINTVIKYILNQETHHKKEIFQRRIFRNLS